MPNEIMKIKEEGMPVHNFPSQHGYLYVKLKIQISLVQMLGGIGITCARSLASPMPSPCSAQRDMHSQLLVV